MTKRQIIRKTAQVVMTGSLLCSCVTESGLDNDALKTGTVALVLGEVSTRSNTGNTSQVNTYSAGMNSQGIALALEEVVTEMETGGVESALTRGTPAYTENVASVHGNTFNGVAYGSSGMVIDDGAFTYMSEMSDKSSIWRRVLGFDPWKQSSLLYFFLRLPANPVGVSNLQYDTSDGSMEFDYTTPSTAEDQQDILFASRQLNEDTYLSEAKSKGGAPVIFRHALTGVKFAIGNNTLQSGDPRNPSGVLQTFIRSVSITGLSNTGHAKFTPRGTEGVDDQSDDINSHTSALSFEWTPGNTLTHVFSQAYERTDIQDFTFNDNVGAPASFYAAGQNRNLNKDDASLTFWFIPQDITDALVLTVEYEIWDGQNWKSPETVELDLGTRILAQTDKPGYTNKTWKAGQLRTFTLKPLMMDVEISDTVTGFKKENVVVRNTGNVNAFLRAHIVANWIGTKAVDDGGASGVALGYVSSTSSAFVESWQMNSATTDNYGGTFTALPGSGWVKGSDGFYYYTAAVAPGAETPPLFTKYELPANATPAVWYPVAVQGTSRRQFSDVHLEMEIIVQAIEATGTATYSQAWAETVTP